MLFNSLLSINSPWISVIPFLPPSKLHLGYYRDLFIECLMRHLFIHSLSHSHLCLFHYVYSRLACVSIDCHLFLSFLFPISFLPVWTFQLLLLFVLLLSSEKKVEVWKCHRFEVSGWAMLLFLGIKCKQTKTAKSLLLLLSTINYYWWCKWPLLNTRVWDASRLTAPLAPLCFFTPSWWVFMLIPLGNLKDPFPPQVPHFSQKGENLKSHTFCLPPKIPSLHSICGGVPKKHIVKWISA